MEIDSSQFMYAIGILIACLLVLKYAVAAVRELIKQAKDFVIDTVGPKPDIQLEVKKALQNGGGDIIKAIVKEANDTQSLQHYQEMTNIVADAIRAHETIEKLHLDKALSDFRHEVTDKFMLKKGR